MREANFSDYDRIAALQHRNGLATMPRSAWMALWRENPVWRRIEHQWPIGWMLATVTGEAVGYIAMIPVLYRLHGRNVLTAATGSWVTDPGYRGYSMVVLNAATRRGGAELYVTNTASAKSDATLRMLGWTRVPAGEWDRSYFWVAGPYGFSRWFLENRGWPAAALAALPVAAGLRLHSSWAARHSRIPSRAGAVERVAGFDSRFDSFWEELEAGTPGVLLGERSAATLSWHFAAPLARGTLRILTRGRGSRIASYAIFDRRDAQGLRRFRLVDFQALEDAPAALASFLSYILDEMRRTGVHVLESPGYSLQVLGDPGRVAPYRRILDAWKYHFKATTPELREALSSPAAWAPSYFDGDASF